MEEGKQEDHAKMKLSIPAAALAHVILFCPVSGLSETFIFTYNKLSHLPDLHALALVESGGDDKAKGKRGEISAYQILPITWREYGKKLGYSLTKANWTNRTYSTQVAKEILDKNSRRFGQANSCRVETPFDTYCMWNMGFDGYRQTGFELGRVNRTTRNAAMRYANLVKFLSGGNN